MAHVRFKVGTQAQYERISDKDSNALYWLIDSHRLYKGSELFAVGAEATEAASGLLSANDKQILERLIREVPNKVDGVINGEKGQAIIFNESDGGGAKFSARDGTASFVGVNQDTNGGIGAQLYNINTMSNAGSKLDISINGMYYTTGDKSALPPTQRMIELNEIATKKDISDASIEWTPIE